MKKFIIKTFIMMVSLCVAITGAYAWFTINNNVSQSVELSVQAPDEVILTVSNEVNNTLMPITGTKDGVTTKEGDATTAYYSATMAVKSPYDSGTIYFDGIDCEDTLSQALRVQVVCNSDGKLFAPTGATTDYTSRGVKVALNSDNVVGTTTGNTTMYVKVFLEGEDAACTVDNYTSQMAIQVKFRVEENND